MKKINFLFILLILSACIPQVTVTSEVTVTLPSPTAIIIPTSTLHPQFIELQKQIAASGETFILISNGKIEFQSPSGVVHVDGIAINPDGSGTFTNGEEEIAFDPNSIIFGVDSFTVDINGQTWKWDSEGGLHPAEEALLPEQQAAMDEAKALFEQMKVPTDAYALKMVDGVLKGYDLEGNEILSGVELNVFWLREALVNSGDLMPTQFQPTTGNSLPGTPKDWEITRIFKDMVEKATAISITRYGVDAFKDEAGQKRGGVAYLLDPAINAWGSVKNVYIGNPEIGQMLIFQTKDGIVHLIPVRYVARDEIQYFWQNATPTP